MGWKEYNYTSYSFACIETDFFFYFLSFSILQSFLIYFNIFVSARKLNNGEFSINNKSTNRTGFFYREKFAIIFFMRTQICNGYTNWFLTSDVYPYYYSLSRRMDNWVSCKDLFCHMVWIMCMRCCCFICVFVAMYT